jgi:hypothetical protein
MVDLLRPILCRTTMTTTNATDAPSTKKAIPIVCPGHTRPLAELHFCTGPKEGTFRIDVSIVWELSSLTKTNATIHL